MILVPFRGHFSQMIERALFVVVLDSATPDSMTALGYECISGKGYNRWFDKSITLCAFANGKVRC